MKGECSMRSHAAVSTKQDQDNSESARHGARSEQKIRQYSKSLEELSGAMLCLADLMKAHGFAEMSADGKTKADRAIKALREFIDKYELAVLAEMKRRKRQEFDKQLDS